MNQEIGDPCEKCGTKLVYVDQGDDGGIMCLHCYSNSAPDPYSSWEAMVKSMFKDSVNILLNETLTDVEWKYAQNCIHSGLRYFESKRMDEALTPKRPARNYNEFLQQFLHYLDTFRNQIVLEDCETFQGRATPESVRLVMDVNIFEASIKDFLKARGVEIES